MVRVSLVISMHVESTKACATTSLSMTWNDGLILSKTYSGKTHWIEGFNLSWDDFQILNLLNLAISLGWECSEPACNGLRLQCVHTLLHSFDMTQFYFFGIVSYWQCVSCGYASSAIMFEIWTKPHVFKTCVAYFSFGSCYHCNLAAMVSPYFATTFFTEGFTVDMDQLTTPFGARSTTEIHPSFLFSFPMVALDDGFMHTDALGMSITLNAHRRLPGLFFFSLALHAYVITIGFATPMCVSLISFHITYIGPSLPSLGKTH